MCLIAIGWKLREDYPLMLAANRDEFFARPSAPAEFWDDHAQILAGRDLQQGGTWLGLSRRGRFAAVTNFRDGRPAKLGRRSRGWLVRDYLLSPEAPSAFLSGVHAAADFYDGFNLIAGTPSGLFHYSNRSREITALPPGAHGLSNHLLNTPWPKVRLAREGLAALGQAPASVLVPGLFALLSDRTLPADEALPDTGIGLQRERLLSTALIRSPEYGTRCSTVLLIDPSGHAQLEERSFAADGAELARRRHELHLSEISG